MFLTFTGLGSTLLGAYARKNVSLMPRGTNCTQTRFAEYHNFTSEWFLNRQRHWREPVDDCFFTSSAIKNLPKWRPNCTTNNFNAVIWSVPKFSNAAEWAKGDLRRMPDSMVEYGEAVKRYLPERVKNFTAGPYGYVPNNTYFFPPAPTFTANACKGKHITVAMVTNGNALADKADFIVVDYPFSMKQGRKMLPRLKPWQHAILSYSGESIFYYPWVASSEFQNYFTLTVGIPGNKFDYRAKNWYVPPVDLLINSRKYSRSTRAVIARKNSIAMMVSNCEPALRKTYLTDLMSKIPVDSYGGCLRNAQLPAELVIKHGGDPRGSHFRGDYRAIKHEVFASYPFVLAFENRNCYDYITEKVYDALLSGSVPIYMGASNIADYLPPKSYIDAAWFTGPGELAAYVEYLLKYPSEYDKYHRWREENASDWKHIYETAQGLTWCQALEKEYLTTCWR
jgi:hypothetical protein